MLGRVLTLILPNAWVDPWHLDCHALAIVRQVALKHLGELPFVQEAEVEHGLALHQLGRLRVAHGG